MILVSQARAEKMAAIEVAAAPKQVKKIVKKSTANVQKFTWDELQNGTSCHISQHSLPQRSLKQI